MGYTLNTDIPEPECRKYYEDEYCSKTIVTHDGIRVYFSKDRFKHAFYECPARDGNKSEYSKSRSERVSWIGDVLKDPHVTMHKGYKRGRGHVDDCRVSIAVDDYVVVLDLSLASDGITLKANFNTAFVADNSGPKIKSAPNWSRTDSIQALQSRRTARKAAAD